MASFKIFTKGVGIGALAPHKMRLKPHFHILNVNYLGMNDKENQVSVVDTHKGYPYKKHLNKVLFNFYSL